MNTFEITFSETSVGKQPAKEFILALDIKMRAKMLKCVEILKANGNDLREPYTKHLEDGIFELRAKQGSDISRVLYFFVIGRKIVLTNGFIKKTQKTPNNEIELAKKYRLTFLAQNKEEEDYTMRDDFDKLLDEQMENPEFKKEYENLAPEFTIVQAIIDARKCQGLTQKELANRTGINQADISKLETGNSNPTLDLLKRLATGMGMVLKVEFVPKQQ